MSFKVNSTFVRFASMALLLFLMSAVAMAQHVVYNYMPGTDFSKYHTYRWVEKHSGGRGSVRVSQCAGGLRQRREAQHRPGTRMTLMGKRWGRCALRTPVSGSTRNARKAQQSLA